MDGMTSASTLVDTLVRQSIADHFAPRVSIRGKDITHHEPVTHVTVRMSLDFTRIFLQGTQRPTHVDDVPIVYAEQPAPGRWDVSTICHYDRNGRPSRSRGRLAVGPIADLTP